MKTIEEMLKGCEHDGCYIPVNETKRLMQEYAEAYHKAEMIRQGFLVDERTVYKISEK